MSLSRFDLMAQLDATKVGLRMGEISNRLMVTTGNITGLTDELEADGLVKRTDSELVVTEVGAPLLRVIAMRFDAHLIDSPQRHSKTI